MRFFRHQDDDREVDSARPLQDEPERMEPGNPWKELIAVIVHEGKAIVTYRQAYCLDEFPLLSKIARTILIFIQHTYQDSV